VVLRFPSPKKTDRHDITAILLKVALNTINEPNQPDESEKIALKPVFLTMTSDLNITNMVPVLATTGDGRVMPQ